MCSLQQQHERMTWGWAYGLCPVVLENPHFVLRLHCDKFLLQDYSKSVSSEQPCWYLITFLAQLSKVFFFLISFVWLIFLQEAQCYSSISHLLSVYYGHRTVLDPIKTRNGDKKISCYCQAAWRFISKKTKLTKVKIAQWILALEAQSSEEVEYSREYWMRKNRLDLIRNFESERGQAKEHEKSHRTEISRHVYRTMRLA